MKARFATDCYVLGEEEYNRAIRNNFRIDQTATQLFEEVWPIVENTRKQMIDLARAIGTSHGWHLPGDGALAVRAVFDGLSNDYPNDPAALQDSIRTALADLSAHEGFPGHDWFYRVLFIRQGTIPPACFHDTLLNELLHRSQPRQ
jgi:hypothetical protein